MKTILTLIAVVCLTVAAVAHPHPEDAPAPIVEPTSPFTVGTNAPAATNGWFGPHVGGLIDFFSQTGTNWSVIPFVTILEDDSTDTIGGGIAATYSLNDYMGAMLRLDYLKSEVYMPSGNFQLQLPINLGGKFQVVPFIITGLATPLNAGDESGEPIGIFGTGLGVRVSNKIGVVYDVEKWSRFDGLQHRIGVLFRF